MRTLSLVLALLVLAAPASAQRYTVENVDVDATVLPDGSMNVREILTYDLQGRFTFAYRDIPRSAATRERGRRRRWWRSGMKVEPAIGPGDLRNAAPDEFRVIIEPPEPRPTTLIGRRQAERRSPPAREDL